MNLEDFEYRVQLVNLGLHGFPERRRSRPAVNGTQGVTPPVWGNGNCTFGSRVYGSGQQGRQERARNTRHVASDNQIPFAGRRSECRNDTADRAEAGIKIAKYWKMQVSVRVRTAYKADRTSRGQDTGGDVRNQNRTAKRQQCFVLTHPLTATSGQNEARRVAGGSHAGSVHEKIIALDFMKEGCL